MWRSGRPRVGTRFAPSDVPATDGGVMPRPVPHPRPRLGVEPLEDRATPSVTSGTGFTAPLTTSGPANGQVVVFTPIPFSGQFNTTRPTTIIPFPGFTGQVRTAWADVNADN